MNTEDLIAALSADARAEPPLAASLRRLALPALAVPALLIALFWGYRKGLMLSLMRPEMLAKEILPVLLVALALPLALRIARPEAGHVSLRPLLWVVAAVAACALVAMAVAAPADWPRLWRGETAVACMISIPTLSVVPLATALWILRRGATLAPGQAGFLAGLIAAGSVTVLYALHCPEDSPLFYGFWYSLAILIVAAAGALAGRMVLRW